MPTAEPDRVFAVVPFGGFRDMVLREFRSALRGRTNPDTGSAFTEAEIAYALAKGSRWWIGAQAIEQVAQIQQSRAVWLADQALPGTASSEWLGRYHAPAWLEEPALLDATGSQGFVLAIAPNGSSFAGSTTPEDPAAVQLRDPSTGRRFQVLSTTVIASGGQREIEVFAIDGGEDTNISIGDVLEWVNAPAGTEPTAEATTNFSGGTDRETDQDRVRRIEDAIRWRQGAGNWAQIRSWARDASNAVEDAFIYPCALGAGTTVVSLVQKRSTATGPLARIPTTSVRDLVRDFIVPPNSRVLPGDPFIVVVSPTSETSDLVIGIYMDRGVAAGWEQLDPWPGYTTTPSAIGTLTTQTSFRINSDTSPSAGVVPALMAWNATASRWERLNVSSVSFVSGSNYDVVLSSAPGFTLAVGTRISPYTQLHEAIAEALEAYFDSLGPGEIVNVVGDDVVSGRAFRHPKGGERWPFRAGAGIVGYITQALGVASQHAQLDVISKSTPTRPAAPEQGPGLLVLGKVAIYAVTT